jgi:putative membrane protein
MPSELPDTANQQRSGNQGTNSRSPIDSVPSDYQSPALSRPIFEGRLHPLTLLFGLIKGLRGAIPIIPLILFGSRWAFAGILIMVFAGTVLNTLVRYFSFSYRIEGNELITQQGVLQRKQRNIPLERVQEIRIEQGVMHRLFGVVDAKIETGGGEGAEASLSVLSRTAAENLRQAVFERVAEIRAGKAQIPISESSLALPERTIIRQLSIKDLVVAGLTSNHLVSAFVLAGALWNFADDLIPESIYRRIADMIYRRAESILAQDAATAAIVTIFIALTIFVVGFIFSIVGSIILFYGFTFSRRGEDLYRSYGLFTKRASSLPRRRIQVLEVEERLLRRLFGLATLRADTSGSHREDEDDNSGRDVLIPVMRRDEVDQLLPNFFEDFSSDQAEWRRVSRLAIRRGTIKGGIICLLIAAALFAYQREPVALWPVLCLPMVYAINVVRYRNLAYALGSRYLRTRRGWLGRSTHIIPINKIQAVEISQTPFDRRLGLATLSVDTAGQAYTGGGPQISNLPLSEAHAIAATLAHQAAATTYKW